MGCDKKQKFEKVLIQFVLKETVDLRKFRFLNPVPYLVKFDVLCSIVYLLSTLSIQFTNRLLT